MSHMYSLTVPHDDWVEVDIGDVTAATQFVVDLELSWPVYIARKDTKPTGDALRPALKLTHGQPWSFAADADDVYWLRAESGSGSRVTVRHSGDASA
jgi:sugar lactone lactonase YvrE